MCYGGVRVEFDEILKLANYVNLELQKGSSVSRIEREHNVGKGTFRKRLLRNGYSYDKEKNQFVLRDNTKVTQMIENQVNKPKQSVLNDNTNITQFTDEEIKILKSIIKNYKGLEVEGRKLEGEIVTRSFRSYKSVMDMFVLYCKENKLSQKDAFAEALLNFMDKNK